MSLEQILNHKISSTRKTKKNSKVNPNNEKNNKEEQQSQKKRLLPDTRSYNLRSRQKIKKKTYKQQ